jgi:hypothetical protein
MVQLAKDPLTRPDIAPIDTGSTNLETFDPATGVFGHADRVYRNDTHALQQYARRLKTAGIKPKLVCWSIGFVRRAAALMDAGLVDEPGYFLLNMTDGPYITGHRRFLAEKQKVHLDRQHRWWESRRSRCLRGQARRQYRARHWGLSLSGVGFAAEPCGDQKGRRNRPRQRTGDR